MRDSLTVGESTPARGYMLAGLRRASVEWPDDRAGIHQAKASSDLERDHSDCQAPGGGSWPRLRRNAHTLPAAAPSPQAVNGVSTAAKAAKRKGSRLNCAA